MRELTAFQLSINPTEHLSFAAMTGDHNPIHVDDLEAKYSIFGKRVVHGMNAALSSLELMQGTIGLPMERLSAISIQFSQPAFPGDALTISQQRSNETTVRLLVRSGITDLIKIRLDFSAEDSVVPQALSGDDRYPPVPEEAKTRSPGEPFPAGSLGIRVDAERLSEAYPSLVRTLGERMVASIALLSTIVGMHWPGERSLFVEAKVRLKRTNVQRLEYSVTSTDIERRLTSIAVRAPDFTASLVAFFRPDRVKQPEARQLADRVSSQPFKGISALVIGGSRGLGEVATKLLAAGGANVFATARILDSRVEQVLRSIEEVAGSCRFFPYSTERPDELKVVAGEISSEPLMLLYFASPHIFRRRDAVYSRRWLNEFLDVYADGFITVLQTMQGATSARIGVYYPSSNILDNPRAELIEYVSAKAAGEAICRTLQSADTRLYMEVPRLPPLLTDQMNPIMAVETADPVDLLLPSLLRIANAILAPR